MAEEGEQEGERVEDDICLAILCQGLHLRCLDLGAADPDDTLDHHCRDQCPDGSRWQRGCFPGAPGEKFRHGFLQDLEEGDDHDDAEDEDSEGLEAAAADGELMSEALDLPGDEFVGGEDYHCAEEVKGGVDEGGDEGEGGGGGGGDYFGGEEEDVGYYVYLGGKM